MTPNHASLSSPFLDHRVEPRGGSASTSTPPAGYPGAETSLYEEAELYDAIVRPGPCEEFYRAEARRGGAVLELACGTGRLTIPLARDGHEIVGLDSSRHMLALAARKAAEHGVAASFLLGDMRGFELGRRFGLVIVSCNSLAHLLGTEDLLSCLRAIRRHLAPDGVLAFDVVHPDLGALSRTAGPTRRLDLGPNPSSAIEAEEEASYDPVSQVRVSRWRVRRPGSAEQVIAPLALRQFFPRELPLLLEAAGLELVARYGDFARNPLGPDSLNQICLARPRTTSAVPG